MDKFTKKVNNKRKEITKKYLNEDIDLIDKKTVIKDYQYLSLPILIFERPSCTILAYKENIITKININELKIKCKNNNLTYKEIRNMNDKGGLSEEDSIYLVAFLYFIQNKIEYLKNENNNIE